MSVALTDGLMLRLTRSNAFVCSSFLLVSCASDDPETASDAGAPHDASSNAPLDASTPLDATSSLSPDAASPAVCPAPDTQVLGSVHEGAVLKFHIQGDHSIRHGLSLDPTSDEPPTWTMGDELILPQVTEPTSVRVFAEATGCTSPERFDHVYLVQQEYEPRAGDPGSNAIAANSESFVAWASGVAAPVTYGEDVDDEWRKPERALGPAEGTALDSVSLGNGGQIVLTFDPPIANGDGADFAVFENGFSDDFLELGFVEVSSDGVRYVRFDSAYLGNEPLDAYDTQATEIIGGLAGKYRAGFGTPFDLDLLRYRDLVEQGAVDLGRITHVRVVDIIGDGATLDSFEHPIYDPTPTVGSGGFDLDGIGVLHEAD